MLRKILLTLTIATTFVAQTWGQLAEPMSRLQYIFDTLEGTNAQLRNGAELTTEGKLPVLSLGEANGYLDLGAEVGGVIATLNDFTVSTYLYLPKGGNLDANGNFVFTFANSANIATDQNGAMFLNAKDTRYAISPKHWDGEQTVNLASRFETSVWHHVAYTQCGTTGTLYIDGKPVKSGKITMMPSALGATTCNYLGRSCYVDDSYLYGARYCDFRLYDTALDSEQTQALAAEKLEALNEALVNRLLDEAANGLLLPAGGLVYDITLPTSLAGGVTVKWSSSDEEVITSEGHVIRPAIGSDDAHVTLTATLELKGQTLTRTFELTVLAQVEEQAEAYKYYLFAYFTGNDPTMEQICFALSSDGYDYTPFNNGEPIIKSDTIAIKKCVRDPHILRGEDGTTFYMVVTDMKSQEGWSSNDGMVLLKSDNLVDWTHKAIDFPDTWPERFDRNNLTRVWAPQTIYDPKEDKYMVYFSIKEKSNPRDIIYYCYANDDFTELTQPQVLCDFGTNTIDADIVYFNGQYHMFFKNEGEGNGIQKAVAPTLQGPWTPIRKYYQQTNVAVEGAGLFHLINSDQWVLMYDCYTSGYYQFCTSPDLENFTFVKNTTLADKFTPRHGTVIPITNEEAWRLNEKWPSKNLDVEIPSEISKPVAVKESSSYYTVSGVHLGTHVPQSQHGIFIRQELLGNGTRRVVKVTR